MKFNIVLAVAAMFTILSVNSYSQNCCENSTSACTQEYSAVHTIGSGAGDTAKGTVCLVSGEAIGEGQGLKFEYYGKVYDFCCEGCLAKFKKEPIDYAKNLECPVMADPIESKDVFVMHEGTKYYVCCPPCKKSFEKNPEKYIGGSK